ncbi:MAG: two pore domain potassium channel family protein [Bacteroidales bacterium]|nr:two pore domain potassium channel family protein [Bacteroidales bacterium]
MHTFFIRNRSRILGILRIAVLIVSVGIIALISVDAFHPHFSIFSPGLYMASQPYVCTIFLIDFFASLLYATHKRSYFFRHILFFIISIPYTWILSHLNIHPAGIWSYILHFLPTLRAVLALAIVMGFVSTNKLIGLFASYITILLLAIYFSSVVFYLHEGATNPGITSYWRALWWCVLQATTLGASFYALTTVGKAIAMIVSVMGVMMFPLFTVYLTQFVRKYISKK